MNLTMIRSLVWTDYFMLSLVDPRGLYRKIKENDPHSFMLSFIVPAIIAITGILASAILGQEGAFFYYKVSNGWIMTYLILVFQVVIASSLMDLLSQFFGYDGNIKEIICLVNFSLFPMALLLPSVYIIKVIGLSGPFFYVFFSFLLMVWFILNIVQGISEMHSIGPGRAVLICLFPAIFIGIMGFFISLLFVLNVIGLIMG